MRTKCVPIFWVTLYIAPVKQKSSEALFPFTTSWWC